MLSIGTLSLKGAILSAAGCFFLWAWSADASSTNFPPIETVLERVTQNARKEQIHDRQFRAHYAFVRTKTTRELDAKGRVKNQRSKESRNNPGIIPASYSPQPGQPAQVPRPRGKQPPQPMPKKQPQAFERNEFVLSADLLSRFDFTLVKRKQLNGRDTLLVAFKPQKRKLPNENIRDRFINKAAGTVWVDEGDWMLSKVDVYLTESVNVVGGLVGAVKKFNYGFDRERTPDGLWYTRNINWRLEGRELFSRKILEYEEKRAEIKKVR